MDWSHCHFRGRTAGLQVSQRSEASGQENTSGKDEDTLWKMIAEAYLNQMYAFRQAVATISRNYFDGEELLFSECTQSLNALFGCVEALVEAFNADWPRNPRRR